MRKILSFVLAAVMVMACGITAVSAEGYTAGTYVALGKGNNGDVEVTVTFSDSAIEKVEVTDHAETPGISDPAIERIPEEIVAKQSLAVDAVAGATNTSNAILEAVADAVKQAGGDVEKLSAAQAEETEKTETEEETEVLVVGSGMAGTAAALEAAQKGAKVTLIEKNAALGGTMAISGGFLISCKAEIFSKAGVADSLADFRKAWEDHMAYSKAESGYPDWERWENVVGDTGKTVDWLSKSGISFKKDPFMGFDGGAYPVAWHENSGPGLAKNMMDILASAGVDMRTETKAVELVTDENGAVTGAVAETKDGNITFKAKSVILATGGISHNEELVAEYSPKVHKAGVVSYAAAGSTGDGLVMAKAVGADVFDCFYSALWDAKVAPEVAKATDASKLATAAQLGVNSKGVRFASEAPADSVPYVDALASDMIQDGNAPFYYIYDSSSEEVTAVLEKGAEAGAIFKADTIEELANQINVDAAALKDTYENYMALCKEGKDTQFGKSQSNLAALDKAPFYAVKWNPTTFGSTGGVKTDLSQRVLKADGSAIPGLYAAGEMSNRYFYNENYILGGSLGLYATCGRRAGDAAVADMK